MQLFVLDRTNSALLRLYSRYIAETNYLSSTSPFCQEKIDKVYHYGPVFIQRKIVNVLSILFLTEIRYGRRTASPA